MLDALSDFWKPMKKSQTEDKLRADQLQIGSAIVFGFVPQASLSGRRMEVTAINTYQFGNESLTSFVLSQERDAGISMIVAESEGEQYLAISRRINISDRIKMFDAPALKDVMENPEAGKLACKDNPDFKGWTARSYRREIQSMKGMIYGGDFRKIPLPMGTGQEFKYTLLASDNNEQAIEIEKYGDGRVEMYATVYRRVSDIGEVSHPMKPELKLASPAVTPSFAMPSSTPAAAKPPEPAPVPVKPEPIALQELTPPPAAEKPAAPAPVAAEKPVSQPISTVIPEEKKTMQPSSEAINARPATNGSPKLSSASVTPAATSSYPQEVKAVSKAPNGMENDAVECDLRVANKIIDEAIRNEMRLSDVVRRIIELPVAHQEAVHIPVTLSDEDYSLLAIRYGIAASDKNSIKRRIIEDLNDFSGSKKQ